MSDLGREAPKNIESHETGAYQDAVIATLGETRKDFEKQLENYRISHDEEFKISALMAIRRYEETLQSRGEHILLKGKHTYEILLKKMKSQFDEAENER